MLLGDDLKEEPMGKDKMGRLYERFMASEDLRNKIREDKNRKNINLFFTAIFVDFIIYN